MRTQSSSNRLRVPKVTPKAHFWSAWATLFEAKVPQCCMYKKHTIYYVLTTLGGTGLPVFSTRPAFATQRSHSSVFFPLFRPLGAPLGVPREPKEAPRPPKATPGASKNRPKIDARTHLGAQAAREVQKGTHPSGNVSKIDAKVVFPTRPPMKKLAMKTPLSSTTFLLLR